MVNCLNFFYRSHIIKIVVMYIKKVIIFVAIIILVSLGLTLREYHRYIGMTKNSVDMRTFYEYLNESRGFDNQGQAFSTIQEIQKILVEKGFLAPTLYNGNNSIDGKFGQATSEALSKFQLSNSLPDTKGIINKDTLMKLGLNVDSNIYTQKPEELHDPKTTSEDLSGLGNFTTSMYDNSPLVLVYGGIDVNGRPSGEYMYDYFKEAGNKFNLFVAKNHRINGLDAYQRVSDYMQTQNIYPSKKVLYLFSGGFRPGFTLLKSVSADQFEKIYLVDIYIGKNQEIANFYADLAKRYPSKVEYYYTGTSTSAGGSRNLNAQNSIVNAVFTSKRGMNHMLTNIDAVKSLLSYFPL
jgi:peptidoglycan hydrolase-like protein with peptidoglycan-binding domain